MCVLWKLKPGKIHTSIHTSRPYPFIVAIVHHLYQIRDAYDKGHESATGINALKRMLQETHRQVLAVLLQRLWWCGVDDKSQNLAWLRGSVPKLVKPMLAIVHPFPTFLWHTHEHQYKPLQNKMDKFVLQSMRYTKAVHKMCCQLLWEFDIMLNNVYAAPLLWTLWL